MKFNSCISQCIPTFCITNANEDPSGNQSSNLQGIVNVQSAPTQPVSVQPAPTQPVSVQPAPTQPVGRAVPIKPIKIRMPTIGESFPLSRENCEKINKRFEKYEEENKRLRQRSNRLGEKINRLGEKINRLERALASSEAPPSYSYNSTQSTVEAPPSYEDVTTTIV